MIVRSGGHVARTGYAYSAVVSTNIEPTDPDREQAFGRIAFWLDPDDLRWLAGHCCCAADATEATRDRCLRLRFRASAALHKAGLDDDPRGRPASTS
ncbi:hypothetical protein GCM10010151_55420 [Actinoallomurus spadix]|uniref:Uncharacterized protein n=1 Tax=Actinoallomurus spadix TaxID=79912 RepID=A0ABN0X9G5_9ACTN